MHILPPNMITQISTVRSHCTRQISPRRVPSERIFMPYIFISIIYRRARIQGGTLGQSRSPNFPEKLLDIHGRPHELFYEGAG